MSIEINNQRDASKAEEKRAEEKRIEAKKNDAQHRAQKSMATFEAKLAEKVSQEEGRKESQTYKQTKTKSEQKESSLLERILSAGKDQKGDLVKSDQQKINHKQEDGHKVGEKQHQKHEEQKISKEERALVLTDKTKHEHKRVESFVPQQGGQDELGGQKNRNKDFSGQSSFSGDSRAFLLKQVNPKNQAGGFNKNARDFTPDNLDEIVEACFTSVRENGNHQFMVQLKDLYFNGLKIMAEQSAQGLILRFICPNAEVRSTFLKFRLKLYAHFRLKNQEVYKIDVI